MTRYFQLLFAIFCTGIFLPVHAQIINTFAGTGIAGYNGDGIACGTAQLDTPFAVAVDKMHNVYISDSRSYRIRKVDASGTISTIAGTGVAGFGGDNGPATLAQIKQPFGIFVDDTGNVLFADANNNRIRKISTTGIITTIAGNGVAGFSGDNAPAVSAMLNTPGDVCNDKTGRIYFIDIINNRIRKIDTSGIITTIAGGGSTLGDNGSATLASLNTPQNIAIDGNGNIYVTDGGNHRIRKISTLGIITTIAGTGIPGFNGDWLQATSAQLYAPVGIKIDKDGNIYITDATNGRVRKISNAGIMTTIAGNGMWGYGGDGGPAVAAKFYSMGGIAVDDSVNMYIADAGNNRIRIIGKVLDVNNISNETSDIIVSPNPNRGFFTINISSAISQQVEIIITNMLGQKIKEYTTQTNNLLEVYITTPPGIYLISAVTASGRTTTKMIIQ